MGGNFIFWNILICRLCNDWVNYLNKFVILINGLIGCNIIIKVMNLFNIYIFLNLF